MLYRFFYCMTRFVMIAIFGRFCYLPIEVKISLMLLSLWSYPHTMLRGSFKASNLCHVSITFWFRLTIWAIAFRRGLGFEHFHCNTFMHPRNKRGYYRRSRKIRVDGFTMSLWGRWRDDSLRTSSGDTNMWTKRRRFYAHKILDWWLGVVDLPCTSITWASHVGKG